MKITEKFKLLNIFMPHTLETGFAGKLYKMFRGFRKNDKFLKIISVIYLEKFKHAFQFLTKCFSYLTAKWFSDSYK